MKEKYSKLMQNQLNQPPRLVLYLEDEPQKEEDVFCTCRGQNQSGFFVACDGGEQDCPHGGWLHPECTEELRNLPREVIDSLEGWYCRDCEKRRAQDAEENSDDSDGD